MPDETTGDDASAPTLSDKVHAWVKDTFGVDPRAFGQGASGQAGGDGGDTAPNGAGITAVAPGAPTPVDTGGLPVLPVMAAMGAPALSPLPDPEGPVSGVRAVEKGIEGAAKILGGAVVLPSAGALAVGAAVVGAILTWSTSTAPPWMDEMNPETGQPYKDEDEWKAVKERRAKPQRGGGRQPQIGPNVAPDDPDYRPPPPSCENRFPSIPICTSSMQGYQSMEEAARAQPQYGQSVRSNVTTLDEYRGIAGGENSHATYYDSSGNKLFTLIKTACCQDTVAGPVLNWRWVAV